MFKAFVFILFFTTFVFPAPSSSPVDFTIITSNIKNDSNNTDKDELIWSIRKIHQIQTLKDCSQGRPTLIGLQEAKKNQVDDIVLGLNGNHSDVSEGWNYFGVGKDDGREAGEYAAILYDEKVWQLVNGTTKWLSTTPDSPSKSWNAEYNRIVSITEMKHKKSGRHLNYLNTHYDQASTSARRHSSELILGFIEHIPNTHPTYLSGDFNSKDTDKSYSILSEKLTDARKAADSSSTKATFTGFESDADQSTIDFVWYSQKNSTKVTKYSPIDTLFQVEGKSYRFSDHRPVEVELTLL